MNGLEAAGKLDDLLKRVEALSRVIYYLSDDRDFSDDVCVLEELYEEIVSEYKTLAEKLREVSV